MKLYRKLNRFPLGAVKAEGFLREQMERNRDGMGGHLPDLEPEMIRDPFINKRPVPAWSNGNQNGWGAEISGNYWTGYIQLAFTLGDPDMIRTATEWVDGMMKKQLPDGYLGTFTEPDAKIYDDYNAWGTSCAMRGLIAFYEATEREDVLEAVHRCMLWFTEKWAGDRKSTYAGPFIIEPMIFTYYYTGDERLVKFALEYSDFLETHDNFNIHYKKMLTARLQFNSNHTAGTGTTARLPALIYSATGDRDYLDATVRRIEQVREFCMNLNGGPVSVTEYLGPVGASTETEYCSFAFFNAAYSYLSFITGEAKYGDYMEEMFYNGTQGARKKDEKAIAYLSSPNQIFATEHSSISYDMQIYAPCYPTSCCPVNSVAVLPEFVRGMFLCDGEGNIYATCYGPCSLTYHGVSVTEKTMYPFRNRVTFEMTTGGDYTLFLRVPEWSLGLTVTVNGKPVETKANADGYAPVVGKWQAGDVLEVSFRAEVKVIPVDDRYKENKKPLAIKYGALLYAYHIPEDWLPVKGNPMTPLPEGWSWYSVFPIPDPGNDASDLYEQIGQRKWYASWNIALDETLTAKDFEIEEIDGGGYVWSDPPIRLHTRAYHAPYLFPPYAEWTYEPSREYNYVSGEKPLTLVPYGCTNLRISYFPKADLSDKK